MAPLLDHRPDESSTQLLFVICIGVLLPISMAILSILVCACCRGNEKDDNEQKEEETPPPMPRSLSDAGQPKQVESKPTPPSTPVPPPPKTEPIPETPAVAKLPTSTKEKIADDKLKQQQQPGDQRLVYLSPVQEQSKQQQQPTTPLARYIEVDLSGRTEKNKSPVKSKGPSRLPLPKTELVSHQNRQYKTIAADDVFEPSIIKKSTPAVKERAHLSFVAAEDYRYQSLAGIDDVFGQTMKTNKPPRSFDKTERDRTRK